LAVRAGVFYLAHIEDNLERTLGNPMTAAIRGSLARSSRTSRSRFGEFDWSCTIRKNMHTYFSDRCAVITERLVGYGGTPSSLREIILCVV
jgi:hypothetical protein